MSGAVEQIAVCGEMIHDQRSPTTVDLVSEVRAQFHATRHGIREPKLQLMR